MDPYYGEIRMFAGNFAPRDWALCDGSLLTINEHSALYSLIGNRYGGDGRVSFALPDMRGRVPVHYGAGPGLTPRILGQRFGTEYEYLTPGQLPEHKHYVNANGSPDNNVNNPTGQVLAKSPEGYWNFTADAATPVNLNSLAFSNTGGNQAHSNIMPCQVLNFIICINGLYPSRN